MISSHMFRTLHLIISPFLYISLWASFLLPQSTRAHCEYRLLDVAVTPWVDLSGLQYTKTFHAHTIWITFRNLRLISHISIQSNRISYWHRLRHILTGQWLLITSVTASRIGAGIITSCLDSNSLDFHPCHMQSNLHIADRESLLKCHITVPPKVLS